ncbi:hypothetical protein [Thiosulfativibrio zosterae]|uniref:Uncharacterized protein n=1 Tax=Thiosulfativibrio zosterae TaxID=2675053 RepID=A0A6F8PK47_9GAMM|nr:hypothetical protein [Thiosulfativibrio zosterae]BBP42434.1 hypothetical protein THMIRHAT_01800 [Thiosulfativibrio zosterae]
MPQNNTSALIEVFFQDTPDQVADTDIVFDETEAQALVLAFYNEHLASQSPNTPALGDYASCLRFQDTHPEFKAKSWYEVQAADEEELAEIAASEPSPTPKCSKTALDNKHLANLAHYLQELLIDENIHLPTAKVHQMLEQAQQLALTEPIIQSFNKPPSNANDTVWLIKIADEDIALYLGNNYIDAASLAIESEHDELVSAAKMLSEKYRAELKEHHFEQLPEGWSWTDVDKIMVKSGLFTHENTPLMVALRTAKSIKMNGQLVQSFVFYEAAFEDYINQGIIDGDVLKLVVDEADESLDIYLTVEEVINATQVKSNQWVCFDSGATELTINRRETEHSVSSLLR